MNEKIKEEVKDVKENSRKPRKRKQNRKSYKGREARGVNTNSRTNDVSWYSVDPVLLRNAACFNFNNPLGNPLRVTEFTKLHNTIDFADFSDLDNAIPGVMRINYIPTVGPSTNIYSQVNIAAMALYQAIRRPLTTQSSVYKAPDMMKYVMALDSIYAMHAFMLRIYGLASIYAQQNRYWPAAILKSMGIDVTDVVSNLSDFRYYLNNFAVKVNSLAVPANMNIFQRHYMLNSTIWKDGGGVKSQLYYFSPYYLYKYDEVNTTDAPSQLVPYTMPVSQNRFKFTEIAELAESLVTPLLVSEDIGIISSDFLRVCGESALAKLPIIDEGFVIEPQYDITMLHQIHNATFVGESAEATKNRDAFKIIELTSQDENAGALYQNPVFIQETTSGTPFNVWALPASIAKIMDVHGVEDVGPEIVMEISRLMVSAVILKDGDNRVQTQLDGFGTEIPTSYEIVTLTADGTLSIVKGYSLANAGVLATATPASQLVRQFGLAPILLNFSCTYKNGENQIKVNKPQNQSGTPYLADLENYSVIANADVKKLHDSALLGLFNIPAYGTYMGNRLQ